MASYTFYHNPLRTETLQLERNIKVPMKQKLRFSYLNELLKLLGMLI